MEMCHTVLAVKYLCKYFTKGHDRAKATIREQTVLTHFSLLNTRNMIRLQNTQLVTLNYHISNRHKCIQMQSNNTNPDRNPTQNKRIASDSEQFSWIATKKPNAKEENCERLRAIFHTHTHTRTHAHTDAHRGCVLCAQENCERSELFSCIY